MAKIGLKEKVHQLLDGGDSAYKLYADGFILGLILLNAVAFVLETIEPVYAAHEILFDRVETVSISVFSVEYLLRVWSCTVSESYKHPVFGRLRFMVSPMALADLLAIAPFYLQFTDVDLRFVRTARLFRLFRLFKLTRYSGALLMIRNVLREKEAELLSTVFVIFLLIFFGSSVMYYCERDAQPEFFSSIPDAMMWTFSKLTTIGKGDVYPVTPLGKTVGSLTALLYLAMFALPTSILGAGFMEQIQKKKGSENSQCPHCGKEISK